MTQSENTLCSPKSRQNYNTADLAKFVCCILVVIIHVTPFAGAEQGSLMRQLDFLIKHCLAKVAVPFFFAMSGFFLYRKTTLQEFQTEPTKRYLHRVFWQYLVWTAIYIPMAPRYYYHAQEGVLSAVAHYVRDVLFYGVAHLWYLHALMIAVIIVSTLLRRKVNPKKFIWVAGALYLCGLLTQSWFGLIVPLRERTPMVWFALKQVRKIIVSTKNGLFEGFLFVSIGMLFAFFDIRIDKMKALAGFLVSVVLVGVERTFLYSINFVKDDSMLLSLVPAIFFLCAFVLQAELPDHPIYRKLRTLSILIFQLHLGVKEVVFLALNRLNNVLIDTCVPFVLTLALSLLASEIIIKLSEKPRYACLKKLYQ